MNASIRSAVGVIMFIILIWYFFGGGLDSHVKTEMDKIENQVAAEAEEQYNIAKRNGTPMDAYVQAGIVSAAYLQASDEVNYQKWKAIEKVEAKRAGIPLE